MSINRICPNCFKEEGIRLNFGPNREAETSFHQQKWCNCGYQSPEEMMQDQDLGFSNPLWVPIIKYFLNEYYLRLQQGKIKNKEEHVRFFLKLLKGSANNYGFSIELVNRKDGEEYKLISDGKTEKKPRVNIFDNSYDLSNLPDRVIFATLNEVLANQYEQSQTTIAKLQRKNIKKSKWISVLVCLLIVLGVFCIIVL
jgi:hypothetical protein